MSLYKVQTKGVKTFVPGLILVHKDIEFSFWRVDTTGIKSAIIKHAIVSCLGEGLFHIRTPASEDPITVLKYRLQPCLVTLPSGFIWSHTKVGPFFQRGIAQARYLEMFPNINAAWAFLIVQECCQLGRTFSVPAFLHSTRINDHLHAISEVIGIAIKLLLWNAC
jgi:hypothetical protein